MQRKIKIVIDRNVYRQIETSVETAYPKEACGVLLGGGKTHDFCEEKTGEEEEPGIILIEGIRELQNREDEERKERYFSTDPCQIYHIERELEKSGQMLIGFYHSHPDCEAVLSEEDKRYMIPGMLYLVVSISECASALQASFPPHVCDLTEAFSTAGIKGRCVHMRLYQRAYMDDRIAELGFMPIMI